MELTLWTYEGPPHIGAMRIATSMKKLHYVLHAPQGDTYADLLFTMIERRGSRPPVTYTTFQARDLGGDTAELVKGHLKEAVDRFKPEALLVGESCTAELIQDQPGALAKGMGFRYVASGPMVRSSYKAGEFYMKAMLTENASAAESAAHPELLRRARVNLMYTLGNITRVKRRSIRPSPRAAARQAGALHQHHEQGQGAH